MCESGFSSEYDVWIFIARQPVFFLLVGACLGSFMNVVFYRYPLRKSVVLPGSACPACGADIAFFDNIPVFAWLFLRGRCRACGGTISWIYPVIEAAFALAFFVAALIFSETFSYAVAAAFGSTSAVSICYLLLHCRRAPWYLWLISLLSMGYFIFEIVK